MFGLGVELYKFCTRTGLEFSFSLSFVYKSTVFLPFYQ
jgi:hypothetical protein